MRIVLFGNAPINNAAIRYRVVEFAHRLEAEGHECRVCLLSSYPLWDRLWNKGNHLTKAAYVAITTVGRIIQMRHIMGADVIFFRGPMMAYGYGPPWMERLVHALNPRMVFDIDDAVWEHPDGVTSSLLRLVDLDWTWKMCRMCVHGIVGNRYLKEQVEPHNPNLTIVPTCIDMSLHTQKTYTPRNSGPVVIGWTGVSTNLVNLQVIEGPLRALAKKYDILLSVAADRDYALDGVPVRNRRWELSHEIDYLQEADIGLMPLLKTKSTIGKCSFKALQHMGVGTPCVVSPVGMNAEIIEDGVDGFLADSDTEWYEKLERLIVDPALRERMGRAARETVATRYSHDVHYPNFRRVMETVAASGQ